MKIEKRATATKSGIVPIATCTVWFGLIAAGCSSPVAVRPDGPRIYGAGDTAAVVFHPQAGDGAMAQTGADESRRDILFASRGPQDAFEQSLWQQPDVPSIWRYRRVPIDTTTQSYLFFGQVRRDYRFDSVYRGW